MEGRIAARSAPDRGAVFAITIPMSRPNSEGEEDQNPSKIARHEPRSLRILLAEDHPTNQKVVAMILELAVTFGDGCKLSLAMRGLRIEPAGR